MNVLVVKIIKIIGIKTAKDMDKVDRLTEVISALIGVMSGCKLKGDKVCDFMNIIEETYRECEWLILKELPSV